MEKYINQKIQIVFREEDIPLLDERSRLCCRMYNELLDLLIEDRKVGEPHNFLKNNNLRNQVPKIKEEKHEYYLVHNRPLKSAGERLKIAYENFVYHGKKFPKYHSWKRNWFSLLYDSLEAFKIEGKEVQIVIGSSFDEKGRHWVKVHGILKEDIMKHKEIKTIRIIKEQNKFYLNVCMIKEYLYEYPKTGKSIAIDPNISNFFVGIDNEGHSIKIRQLGMMEYFEKQISKVKAKRDKCDNKAKLILHNDGRKEYAPSNRWTYLNDRITKLFIKRKAQVKSALYVIAKYLVKEYDVIAIGNYYAKHTNNFIGQAMKRKMLDESEIGEFRRILKITCEKYGKAFIRVDERKTTKKCFNCGYEESKSPDIRKFLCPNCNKIYDRDVNSAINIGTKAGLWNGEKFARYELEQIDQEFEYTIYGSRQPWSVSLSAARSCLKL